MITIETARLSEALAGIVAAADSKTEGVPVLQNCLIEAGGTSMTLTSTNLDVQLQRSVNLSVGELLMEQLRATVNAKIFAGIVRKLPSGGQTKVLLDGDKLVITSGRSRFTLPTLPVDDFPIMTMPDATSSFSISAMDLLSLINRTAFAASTEAARYYLCGIYFHAVAGDGGDTLIAAATDGRRLARVHMAAPDGAESLAGIIVPTKSARMLVDLLDPEMGEVEVSASPTKVRFGFADCVLTSKLVDGQFPDYTRVIPTENGKVLRAAPAELAEVVDRVTTICTDKVRAVKVNLSTDRIQLSVADPSSGLATEELGVDYDAGMLEIGFNSKFLNDVLRHIGGADVEILLDESNSPAVVRAGADADALYVIMPFRV